MATATRTRKTPDTTQYADIREWEKVKQTVEVPDETEGTKPVIDEDEAGDKLEEKAPVIKPPTIAERAKERVQEVRDKARKVVPASKKTSPSGVKVVRPRLGVDKLIGRAWGMLANMAAPMNVPVARVLQMQAPVAGMVLDGVVKNTVVDRVLQPIARVEQGGETVFALVGPPLIVGAITTKPHLAPMLAPLLKDALRTWINVAGPHIIKAQEEEAKFQEMYGQRIDEMIAYIFDQGDDKNGSDAQ